MKVWISKRDAIALVVAAQGPDVLSRSSARSTLAEWVRAGRVRTKATTERPPGCKHFRRLYRRADIALCIAQRPRFRRLWGPHEDALLGTDVDRVIARRLRVPLHVVQQRRYRLGIPAHGAGGGRCNPGSWRRAPDDPRLEPPDSPLG
jgi:hypothetical protein